MDEMRFAPELFEFRSAVMAALDERGYAWLSDYSAVDPVHDAYGIEVCGITEEADARRILAILNETCTGWRPGRIEHKEYGCDPGWKVRVVRDRERQIVL